MKIFMRKEEFLKLLSKRAGISYEEAEFFYDKFIHRLTIVLKLKQSIRIPGFGEFGVKVRKERKIYDRKTGLERVIPSKLVVNFSPAKIFTEKINIRYRSLKPVPVKVQTLVTEEKETSEFNLTFFELGAEKVETEIKNETFEKQIKKQTYETVADIIGIPETKEEPYLSLPSDVGVEVVYGESDVEVPVLDVFPKVEPVEEMELKTNLKEETKMPEFNLTEEPQQPKGKLFDDTSKKEEEKMTAFEYEEENQKRTGFWIFILIVFLIFVGGVLFLLNQYGYIHLWGEGKKESGVEFKRPEEVVVTTPPSIEPREEKPTVIEEKKTEAAITTPKVEKVTPRVERAIEKAYVIQVASFQDKKLADAYANNLRKKGYNAFVERAFVEWKGGNWYRVRIGFFDSIEQANEIARRLKNTEKLEQIWISETSRSVSK